MSTDLLKFKKPEEVKRKELAVIAELVGVNGELSLNPANVANHDKRVIVTMTKEDGTVNRVCCSRNVSKGIRNKSISIPNLVGFSIYESQAFQRDNNGDQMFDPETGEALTEPYASVELPTGSTQMMVFKTDKVEQYVAPIINTSELVAF